MFVRDSEKGETSLVVRGVGVAYKAVGIVWKCVEVEA